MRTLLLFLLFTAVAAQAHRLDEYLQATLISVEPDRIEAQVRLTPGVAVLPLILQQIGSDRRAYEKSIVAGLSLSVDGARQQFQLRSTSWPPLEEMQQGRGEIRLDVFAVIPKKRGDRQLVFENHNQPAISVYLVNCLTPRQPDITINAQKRNYDQSFYRLDYTQSGTAFGSISTTEAFSAVAVFILLLRLAWLWRARSVVFAGRASTT